MAGYLSPATFQTPNEWKATGALGGFLAGMNQDTSNQIVQREFAQDDLDRQMKEIKAKEDQGLLSSKLAKAAYDEAKANADRQRIDSGKYAEIQSSDDAAKLSHNDAAMSTDKETIRQNVAPIFQQMNDDLQRIGGKLDPFNQQHMAMWNSYRDELGKNGVKLPPWPTPEDMVKLQDSFEKSKAYIAQQAGIANRPDRIKAEAAQAAHDASYKQATKVAQIGADSREAVAEARRQGALEVQQAKTETAQLSKKIEEMNVKRVERAKAEGKIDEEAMGAAEDIAQKQLNDRMKVDTGLKMSLALAPSDDAKAKIIQDELTKGAERILPGYTQAKMGKKVEAVTSAINAPDKSDMKAQATSAWGSYEPDKYTYGINPKTGKFARKPK